MKNFFLIALCATGIVGAQPVIVAKNNDGFYRLTSEGGSYFAEISLDCAGKFDMDEFPAFHGCLDWHSSVHNHWCMIRLLKKFPNLPQRERILNRLRFSLSQDNIFQEVNLLKTMGDGWYEFPYGQSWFLKLAEELKTWDYYEATYWLNNIKPMLALIEKNHMNYWSKRPSVPLSGSHDSPAMGISFALDYARAFNRDKLEGLLVNVAKRFYLHKANVSLADEPIHFDFMSAGLLVVDLMRKVLSHNEFVHWMNHFSPILTEPSSVDQALAIKKTDDHFGYEAHWDGFHLNRIWCLNGILSTWPEGESKERLKLLWVNNMNAMWDYAQKSIGKGNYDVDHWLSSFSVFALLGYHQD
ncbi:MAG: DUF2891 family protein [Flavobacteriales bacterium]